MKISLKWLNEFVEIKEYFERPDQLAQLLTGAGLEVEEIHDGAQQFKFVKTAMILEKDKHPDAEKLTVCKVTTGEGVVHQIVCGAKNHKAHDRVVLALPGAILPGNFAIKNSVIRGVSSGGMLCSYKELGLEETSDGIAILPETAPMGVDFAEYAELNDITFELKVTPNRSDCLSHLGLAREISCLLDRPLKTTSMKMFSESVASAGSGSTPAPAPSSMSSSSSTPEIQLQVLNPEMCPRYTGRIIRGVKVGASPNWLKKRLETLGMNSINNVVDITNYVMMELGQPLHAFDLRHIQGGQIRVGKATPQEKFITLDGTELSLKGEELMIQDAHRSLCMAGVIGGKNSGVQDDTQNIFLESAYFAPQWVRRSARQHGLNTDSGYRFSRGVDPNITREALNRASYLLQEIAGGIPSPHNVEVRSTVSAPTKIIISPETISQRLGYPVEVSQFESWMNRLGCSIEKTGSSYQISPPSWRFDLEIDMDIVEEYARLNGYEHIPETLPPLGKSPTSHDSRYSFQSYLINTMTSLGYSQALNFAFVSDKKQNQFIGDRDLLTKSGLVTPSNAVALINPLNEQINVMRTTLSMGLIDNLHHNFHHGVEAGRLFEVGSIFDHFLNSNNFTGGNSGSGGHSSNSGTGNNPSSDNSSVNAYSERFRWAGLAWGWPQNLWTKNLTVPVVMDLKQTVEETLSLFGFKKWQWIKPSEVGGLPHFLHPGQSVTLQLNGKKIGFLGTLHPSIRDEMKLRCDAAIFEFETEEFIKRLNKTQMISPLSKFQAVDRDLSLLMPSSLSAGAVQQEMTRSGGATLQSVTPIDLYIGEKLATGQKSITYRLRFQDANSTLTDEQIQKNMDNIILNIKKHWEIQVR